MASQKFVCANWDPGNPGCKEIGTHTCKNCRLVLYCGPDCQKAHWKEHKIDCRSPLSKDTWMPAWYLEGRWPSFTKEEGPDQSPVTFYFGNMPAIDVLKLSENEGEDYDGVLSVLFAASGDPRNIFKTIADIPETRAPTAPFNITINDQNPAIVARNIIFILIAMVVEDMNEAIDCIIHVWYSSLIRKSDLDILQKQVKPLIQGLREKLIGKFSEDLWGRIWDFESSSLTVALPESTWDDILACLDIPNDITVEDVLAARKKTIHCNIDRDDRELLHMTAHTRVSVRRFLDDGILLPFGTLVKDGQAWPKQDCGRPAAGWCAEDVSKTPCGGATSDTYGKIFYHLREVLGKCLRNMLRLDINFHMMQMNAERLCTYLPRSSYSRIEVSNIMDDVFVGAGRTLCAMTPLLKLPHDNPHATLISLFMLSVRDTVTEHERRQWVEPGGRIHALSQHYLLPRQMTASPTTYRLDHPTNHPNIFMNTVSCGLLAERDVIFNRYLRNSMALEIAQMVGLAEKGTHTIVPKWPFRLKLKKGEAGSVEELHRLAANGRSEERYMEWRNVRGIADVDVEKDEEGELEDQDEDW